MLRGPTLGDDVQSLSDLMRRAPMSFALPSDISYHQLQTKNGMVYTFRHQTLGELGRIIIEGTPDGQCRISSDVVGDSADPMTAKREEIFRPLSEQLTSALDAALGDRAKGMAVPPSPQQSVNLKQSLTQ